MQQWGCARQQLTLHPAQLTRGVPATHTAASDRACALQCPLCDPEPRQRPLAPTEQLCTAHKNTVRVRTVRPFWRAAVSRALRSQFWADFAEIEICHGARTRRWRHRITSSSRARRSMLPKAGLCQLVRSSELGRFLLAGLPEDNDVTR